MTLPDDVQYGLELNLPSLLARERIRNNKIDWTNPDGVYNVFLLAFDDEDAAEKAQFESLKLIVDQHCGPSHDQTRVTNQPG